MGTIVQELYSNYVALVRNNVPILLYIYTSRSRYIEPLLHYSAT